MRKTGGVLAISQLPLIYSAQQVNTGTRSPQSPFGSFGSGFLVGPEKGGLDGRPEGEGRRQLMGVWWWLPPVAQAATSWSLLLGSSNTTSSFCSLRPCGSNCFQLLSVATFSSYYSLVTSPPNLRFSNILYNEFPILHILWWKYLAQFFFPGDCDQNNQIRQCTHPSTLMRSH